MSTLPRINPKPASSSVPSSVPHLPKDDSVASGPEELTPVARLMNGASDSGFQNAVLLSSVKDVVDTATQLSPYLGAVGAVGSVGLMATSAHKILRAGSTEKRLEAVSNFVWGAQGAGLLLDQFAPMGHWVGVAAACCGVAGGVIEMGLGAVSIARGLEMKKPVTSRLGLIDLMAGACWVAGSVGVSPTLTTAGFLALTLGGKAYRYHDGLEAEIHRVIEKTSAHSPDRTGSS